LEPRTFFVIALFSIPVVLMHLYAALEHRLAPWRARFGERAWGWGESAAYASMSWLILVNCGTPGEFIYFQF
jgi:hypothetical protein